MIATRMIALSAFAILPVLGRVASLAARDTCDGGSGTVLCCSFLASVSHRLLHPAPLIRLYCLYTCRQTARS